MNHSNHLTLLPRVTRSGGRRSDLLLLHYRSACPVHFHCLYCFWYNCTINMNTGLALFLPVQFNKHHLCLASQAEVSCLLCVRVQMSNWMMNDPVSPYIIGSSLFWPRLATCLLGSHLHLSITNLLQPGWTSNSYANDQPSHPIGQTSVGPG